MDIDVLFAGVPVGDFVRAESWYERFFGRPPDIVAHEKEVMWKISEGGWLYIVHDPERAGNGLVAIAVSNIEAAIAELEVRGVAAGPIEAEGPNGRKALVRDLDGNSLAVIEVRTDG